MDGRVDFQLYYEAIGETFGMWRIYMSLDLAGITNEHVAGAWNAGRALNSIPIRRWDNIGQNLLRGGGLAAAFKAHGDICSEAGMVSVAKAAARKRMGEWKREAGIIHLVERVAERATLAEYYISLARAAVRSSGRLAEMRAIIAETGVTVEQVRANAANAWSWCMVDHVFERAAQIMRARDWAAFWGNAFDLHGDAPTVAGVEFMLNAVALEWAGVIPQGTLS